ncbi:unnamed protein product [Caenorhabditis nigoni]
MNDIQINGDPAYINYQFDPFTVPVLIAVVPLAYLVPTIAIVVKVIRAYVRNLVANKKDERINQHVFFVITLHLVTAILYLIIDYTTIRIPATGIITSWCASQQPNHGLKILFLLSVYFNYTALLFPCLLSVLRIISIYYPAKVDEIKQAEMLILNSIFWLCTCTITNIVLYKKLSKMRTKRKSAKLRRAEFSLTLITISMFPSFITNVAFVGVYLISPAMTAYFIALRPIGSDIEFVLVSWIFYSTHPIFKTQKVEPIAARTSQPTF